MKTAIQLTLEQCHNLAFFDGRASNRKHEMRWSTQRYNKSGGVDSKTVTIDEINSKWHRQVVRLSPGEIYYTSNNGVKRFYHRIH